MGASPEFFEMSIYDFSLYTSFFDMCFYYLKATQWISQVTYSKFKAIFTHLSAQILYVYIKEKIKSMKNLKGSLDKIKDKRYVSWWSHGLPAKFTQESWIEKTSLSIYLVNVWRVTSLATFSSFNLQQNKPQPIICFKPKRRLY